MALEILNLVFLNKNKIFIKYLFSHILWNHENCENFIHFNNTPPTPPK